MMRLIILCPPGGVSGVRHRCYTAQDKIAIISQIHRIKRDTGVSYQAAAASVGVSHALVICWCTLRERFNNLNIKQLLCYSDHDGSCGQHEEVKEALLAWIFERREMGFAVLMPSVIIKACALLPVMEQKSFMARWMMIRCFLKKYSIVHRLGTKVSQRPPAKAIQEVMEFQQFIKPMLLGLERDLHFIINMDQMPVYFLMHPTRMLYVLGKKSIVIRTTMNNTKHATVALTITAAGDKLVPMVMCKGAENGHIKQRELVLHDPRCIYETQANVWMDKRVMLH
jgi:hypothetical protein